MRGLSCLFLVLVSCGRSECQDYVTVMCEKSISCNVPKNASFTSQYWCENDGNKAAAAAHLTDEQCRLTRQHIIPMSCADYAAYLAPFVASR